MLIFPAIDILEGKVVRLSQGKFSSKTVYSDNPLSVAIQWQEEGAKFLHIVDLDGAKAGKPINLALIEKIAHALKIPIQLGGGVRDINSLKMILDKGVERVILGSVVVQKPRFLSQACSRFGERIVVGIDARHGLVSIAGWRETTAKKAVELAREVEASGAKTIIFTDIERDGMLISCNIDGITEILAAVKIPLIASGGISTTEDIIKLKKLGLAGIIIGKAFYDGKLTLSEAMEAAQ
ncbi:1-(5-phosphoribosyl)-5-[(5-phosphoribosylamino)methylideneamino]imidazole-4-carboxamide isomerase [candidate division NPL-UPA2 bacterium Unc8]|uniref:1-(5-phosphoribosyl)-5-[(5-phosphoribosylamino)methylideneamino] imidazole-4-carboxamide isomerase n=1 Tax=candidate division NPL-UPA2 bacterium Unc8 TaxID=1980939 RepID=A0A399FYW8_UNCN2|nr:MAG: 1-(5-phosphoribosyl)-5-[(5-phosphoribosylamino)methylideneamino]imidazole-4-carboxamide isomerase [candidate division NPL-UPA2 bacterium Unc8]